MKKRITEQGKIEFFDKMWPLFKAMNEELHNYKTQRKDIAKVEAYRAINSTYHLNKIKKEKAKKEWKEKKNLELAK